MPRVLSNRAFWAVLAAGALLFLRPRTQPAQAPQTAPPAPTPTRSLRAAWPIIRRAAAGFLDDRIMAEAAGVTFYAMLALFPAIASLISIYGLVADTSAIAGQLQNLNGILPGGGIDIIKAQIAALTTTGNKALGLGVFIGLATSLWSANAGIKAFFDALNVVYHEREKRSYLRLTLISFAFTLGMIAFLVIAMVSVVVVPVVLNFVGLGSITATLLAILRWPLMLFVSGLLLAILYRYGPSRPNAHFQWISWGSAFASISWLAASLAFSYYVANFGSYNKTYGSLGAAVGFMTWIWISSMCVLMGAEINDEIERVPEEVK